MTSEGRTLSGISGNAGTGTQSFTYDRLNRVMGSGGLSATHGYTYDPDGNRLTDITGGVTTTYTYDRADQLKTRKVGAGSAVSFAYDARGNLTANAESGATTTAYTYDWADRLLSIDPPGASNTVAFTLDALGRNATRTVNGTLDSTYSYLGTTETVVRLATDGGVVTSAAVDALGDRVAVKAGDASFFGWLLPDLHGNTAAALSENQATVSDALRYDAWGQLAASATSGLPTPWRYQGRLLVSTSGTADLYDFSARFYAPGLAAFTQLDQVMGQAADPLSMNRYLYAEANPATMIDPTGHGVKGDSGCQQARCRPGSRTITVTEHGHVPGSTGTAFGGGSSTGGGGGGGTFTTTADNTPATLAGQMCARQPELCRIYFPWEQPAIEHGIQQLTIIAVGGVVLTCTVGGACIALGAAAVDTAASGAAAMKAGTGLTGACAATQLCPKAPQLGQLLCSISPSCVGGEFAPSLVLPGGSLAASTTAGGHLIEKHVGLSEAELAARLAGQKIPAASSFYDLEIAENASAATLRANAAQVAEWLRGSEPELPLTLVFTYPVGVTIPRGTQSALEAYGVRLLLRRTDQLAEGYYVHTGYPFYVGTP